MKYIAKLSGIETAEFYLEKLKSNPSFSVKTIKQKQKIFAYISGPQKFSETESLEEINKNLSIRARELGINSQYQIIENVKRNIYHAQQAEQIAFSKKIKLEALSCKKGGIISIILEVKPHGNPEVDECISYYAKQRIYILAHALGMNLLSFN